MTGLGIRDRIIDTTVKVVDLILSGDLVRKAKGVADTVRGRDARYDDAPTYARPEPPPPAPEPPAPAPVAPTPPAYRVAKGEAGWELSKDGEVIETHKRKHDAMKPGRAAARAEKGTLIILKLDGSVGEEVDYGDSE